MLALRIRNQTPYHGNSLRRLTLVARGDGVVVVVGRLRSPDDMAPPGTDLGSGRDRDYSTILMPNVLVARETRIVHVLDRVVAVWSANALQLTLVDTIDPHLLERSMCRHGRDNRREERSREEHAADQLGRRR